MTIQPTETTDTLDQDTGDEDTLTHRVCPPCELRDKEKGIPPAALCGKRKYGWRFVLNDTPQERCVVCQEMMPAGCPRCGFRWPVAP